MPFAIILNANAESSLAVTDDAFVTRATILHQYETPNFKTNVICLASNVLR